MSRTTAPDAPSAIDPDPFGIGIGIFAAMVSGASFLETRRTNTFMQQQQRAAFRSAWFASRRSVIYFKRSLDEFETYILEDGYGRRAFRVGSVRLTVDSQRAHQLKRLRGQTLTTAHNLGNDLDGLSTYLGPEDQGAVTAILDGLIELGTLPVRYADLITSGRQVVGLYNALLDGVADRQGFEEDVASYSTEDG